MVLEDSYNLKQFLGKFKTDVKGSRTFQKVLNSI